MKKLIEPEKFREMVKRGVWFTQALQKKYIDYWNFNCFLFSERKAVFAIREEDLSLWKGFQEIDSCEGLSLIEGR